MVDEAAFGLVLGILLTSTIVLTGGICFLLGYITAGGDIMDKKR